MSLSARITIEPSRTVAALERAMAAGGVVVTAATAAWRWPSATVACVAAALVAFALLAVVDRRRRGRAVRAQLVVGDQAEVGFATAGAPADDGSSWTLAEPTMVWRGFAVVALAPAGGGAAASMPLATGALPARDRRALDRFLVWSLRARGGRPAGADRR